jgi:hypothetical protein
MIRSLKFTTLVIGLCVFFAMTQSASADAPTVSSFVATPSSINPHQIVSFVWNIPNGGGYSFLVPCVQGIKFYKDGSPFSCGTKLSSVLTASDGIMLTVSNISGSVRSFTARIIPKDATGVDYNAGAQDVLVNIGVLPDPILSFTTSATTTISGSPTILSWSSQDIDGVNMVFECNENIRASSTSYLSGQFIPCGNPLFTSDLPSSGSMSFQFFNNTLSSIPYTVRILPSIAPGIYDGTHSQIVTFNIESDILPDPVTNSFTAPASMANSGEVITFSWGTSKSDGANIQIGCNTQLSAQTIVNGATSTLPCNTPAFSTPLTATSTASIAFINKSFTTEPVTIYLFPLRKGGGYDATRGKQITLMIRAPQTVQTQNTTAGTSSSTSGPKYTFTKALSRGSRGVEVTALQEFLTRFPDIYPNSQVTGFYGALTEQAVKRFQVKYGVASSGTAGYGSVGPKTRAKLNSL